LRFSWSAVSYGTKSDVKRRIRNSFPDDLKRAKERLSSKEDLLEAAREELDSAKAERLERERKEVLTGTFCVTTYTECAG
jgi:hypothetical protein